MKNKKSSLSPLNKDNLDNIIKPTEEHCVKMNKDRVKIIDLGTGYGHVSLPLLKLGYKVTCVDMNAKLLNNFKIFTDKLGIPRRNIKLMKSSIENLKTTKKYDVVLLTEVLEHVNNPDIILRKAHQLLKEKGLFILSIPNGYGSYELFFDLPLIYLRKILKITTTLGYYHVNFFTMNRIKRMLDDNKFLLRNIKKSGFFPILPRNAFLLEKIDIFLANIMPYFLVNRWFFYSLKDK